MRFPVCAALTTLSLLVGTGCQGPQALTSAPPEQQVTKALEAFGLAMQKREPGSVEAFFDVGITILEGNAVRAKGITAASLYFGASRLWITKARLLPMATVLEGEIIRQTGRVAHVVKLDSGKSGVATGRFEAIWKKGPEGTWRIQRLEFVPSI